MNFFLKKLLPQGTKKRLNTNDVKILKTNFGPGINIELIGGVEPDISIGPGTYCNGMKIYCWDNRIKITICRYCSLADNLIITAGGEHDKDCVSNYPFLKLYKSNDDKFKNKIRFKGNIVIGNDVWIANNVSILSGVTIGDGAVIGQGSNVVKNIEPYGIAVGNPAKVIKKRFDENSIEKLLLIKWWDWPLDKIKSQLHLFDDVDKFIENALSS